MPLPSTVQRSSSTGAARVTRRSSSRVTLQVSPPPDPTPPASSEDPSAVDQTLESLKECSAKAAAALAKACAEVMRHGTECGHTVTLPGVVEEAVGLLMRLPSELQALIESHKGVARAASSGELLPSSAVGTPVSSPLGMPPGLEVLLREGLPEATTEAERLKGQVALLTTGFKDLRRQHTQSQVVTDVLRGKLQNRDKAIAMLRGSVYKENIKLKAELAVLRASSGLGVVREGQTIDPLLLTTGALGPASAPPLEFSLFDPEAADDPSVTVIEALQQEIVALKSAHESRVAGLQWQLRSKQMMLDMMRDRLTAEGTPAGPADTSEPGALISTADGSLEGIPLLPPIPETGPAGATRASSPPRMDPLSPETTSSTMSRRSTTIMLRAMSCGPSGGSTLSAIPVDGLEEGEEGTMGEPVSPFTPFSPATRGSSVSGRRPSMLEAALRASHGELLALRKAAEDSQSQLTVAAAERSE
eukprot:RCo047750